MKEVSLITVTPQLIAAYEAAKRGGHIDHKQAKRLMKLGLVRREGSRYVCTWRGWEPVPNSLAAVRNG